MIEKGIFINELVEANQNLEGIFVTTDVNRLTDRNGHPYWAFNLVDRTGSLPARIWSASGRLTPEELESRTFVHVRGGVSFFRDKKQIRIDALRPLGPDEVAGLRMDDYLSPSPYDGEALMQELMALVDRELAGTVWADLVASFFDADGNRAAFAAASAAKAMHHKERGGLVAHTLEVCRICLAMADLFPRLDRPLLLAGALFHDIGKMREMETGPFETSYTTEGNVIGHITLGIAMLEPHCRAVGLPDPLRTHLYHLILSHHGRTEFGAVKEPRTMEAVVLSGADLMDARINTMTSYLAGVEPGAFSTENWGLPGAPWRPLTTRELAAQAAAGTPAAAAPATGDVAAAGRSMAGTPASGDMAAAGRIVAASPVAGDVAAGRSMAGTPATGDMAAAGRSMAASPATAFPATGRIAPSGGRACVQAVPAAAPAPAGPQAGIAGPNARFARPGQPGQSVQGPASAVHGEEAPRVPGRYEPRRPAPTGQAGRIRADQARPVADPLPDDGFFGSESYLASLQEEATVLPQEGPIPGHLGGQGALPPIQQGTRARPRPRTRGGEEAGQAGDGTQDRWQPGSLLNLR